MVEVLIRWKSIINFVHEKFISRLLEIIEEEPTDNEAAVNEIRQKFSTSVNNGGEQSATKMEVDDNNSMKVNTPSRQSSAAVLQIS